MVVNEMCYLMAYNLPDLFNFPKAGKIACADLTTPYKTDEGYIYRNMFDTDFSTYKEVAKELYKVYDKIQDESAPANHEEYKSWDEKSAVLFYNSSNFMMSENIDSFKHHCEKFNWNLTVDTHKELIKEFFKKKVHEMNLDIFSQAMSNLSDFQTMGDWFESKDENVELLSRRLHKPKGNLNRYSPIKKDTDIFVESYGLLGDLLYDLMNDRNILTEAQQQGLLDSVLGLKTRVDSMSQKEVDGTSQINFSNFLEFIKGMVENAIIVEGKIFSNSQDPWNKVMESLQIASIDIFGDSVKKRVRRKKIVYMPKEDYTFDDVL